MITTLVTVTIREEWGLGVPVTVESVQTTRVGTRERRWGTRPESLVGHATANHRRTVCHDDHEILILRDISSPTLTLLSAPSLFCRLGPGSILSGGRLDSVPKSFIYLVVLSPVVGRTRDS